MWMAIFPNPASRCLLTVMILQLPRLDSGYFKVLGPLEPILALVGKDSELPCHLSPTNVSAEHMELRWFRNMFSPAVLVYQDGQEQQGEQMPEYQGRVTLVQDSITLGRAAVKIHHIRVFDEGVYGCFFRDKHIHGEAFMHLKVAALGSDPHITMEVQENGQIRLECTSVGWYPEPQVQWRTPTGEKLPSSLESKNPDEEGLFTVTASVTIRDNSIDNMSCCIQNLLLGQKKEAGVSIPASSFLIWKTLMWPVIFVGLIVIGTFFSWKLYGKIVRKRKDKTGHIEWQLARLYAVDVTLDPDTAHPYLFLYEDSKSVRLEESHQKLPNKPERFDSWPCVLGQEAFTSGRHYWEVDVGYRTDWLVGVCKENVIRKGFILMSPKTGYWVMELSEKAYWALTQPRIPLVLAGAPRQVGIFLDYELGTVSFYNVNDRSHIYTFPKTSFSGPLRPLFLLWTCDKNPLIICPIVDKPPKVTVLVDAQSL
uniref:Uncharacterized protein n=1 Tax=Castor canadensis TaxID=51338 RepID=A0A8C0X3E0_CASCN|nr:butyrophilin subfamily 1 member A1-like [Castor canadensis]